MLEAYSKNNYNEKISKKTFVGFYKNTEYSAQEACRARLKYTSVYKIPFSSASFYPYKIYSNSLPKTNRDLWSRLIYLKSNAKEGLSMSEDFVLYREQIDKEFYNNLPNPDICPKEGDLRGNFGPGFLYINANQTRVNEFPLLATVGDKVIYNAGRDIKFVSHEEYTRFLKSSNSSLDYVIKVIKNHEEKIAKQLSAMNQVIK